MEWEEKLREDLESWDGHNTQEKPQTRENEHMFLVVITAKSVTLLNILFFLKLLLRHYIIQKGNYFMA